MADASTSRISTADLKRMLDDGASISLLDVRNAEEFARWRIEGRQTPPTINVPYFDFMEEPEAALARIPNDGPMVVVCAKGESSAWVADEFLRPRGYKAANLDGGMAAWAAFYDVHSVPEAAGAVRIWQLERPARGCLHYVIGSGADGRCAVVIDPPRHLEPVLNLVQAEGLEIRHIFDTHSHADHLSGGPALAAATGAPYYLHPYDGIHPIDVMPAAIPFNWLHDGESFQLGPARLQAMHVPGHTLGMTALLLHEGSRQFLFCGDTIFLRSIARPDLGGRGDTWAPLHYRSLTKRLLGLHAGTIVLPGHFSTFSEARSDGLYIAPLGELKVTNPELTPRTEEDFVRQLLARLPTFPPQYVDIKRANAGLLNLDTDAADELELGRNLCALAAGHD